MLYELYVYIYIYIYIYNIVYIYIFIYLLTYLIYCNIIPYRLYYNNALVYTAPQFKVNQNTVNGPGCRPTSQTHFWYLEP